MTGFQSAAADLAGSALFPPGIVLPASILVCGGPEDREGRGTAIHCLPSRKRRGLAQLENAGRCGLPVLVRCRVAIFGRRNLASVRGDAVAFIRTGRVTPLNLVGPALGARYPFPPRVHDANQARGGVAERAIDAYRAEQKREAK